MRVAVLALGTLSLTLVGAGCVQPNEYRGMGVFQASGALPLIAEQTLTMARCPQPSAYSDPTPTRDFMALGDECVLEGTAVTGGFSADGGTCTLDFKEGRRTLRVSTASVRVPPSRHDWGVTLTGEDVATGQQVLYRLTITRVAVDDARSQGLCDRARGPAGPSARGDS
jgi:hypothetical protein